MTTSGSKIVAMGHYQPARVLTNDDLAQMVDTNDQWIRDRVGIVTRRIADTETVADMATAAAGNPATYCFITGVSHASARTAT